MSNIDKHALRYLATALDGDDWHAEGNSVYGGRYDVGDSVCYDLVASCESVDGESPLADFIAAANPAVVLELLDELESAEKRIAELETICAESYQVVSALADAAGVFETSEAVSKALDNLSQTKLTHSDVLPFIVEVKSASDTGKGE
ncbi:TPA: ead/Ea22-like family protein [Enterobacter hormaechei subsp. steigerwaltii]|mgnify:CR=1 FL=1|uniref:ead/Ea22-like family protein n=1 Tax=Enterobacter cloacae complex TaxID=354276 RepID=UPI0022EC1C69|nr:ead/Ea22-like family protein [Enterobacter hormaechei]HAV1699056.1 ead/Ea22-like family protein [Enterobacter hormaechei subsp. steigerwaltii]EHF4942228.1 ead/Ea22-like family protein [Enterobacter hormaechei]EHF5009148.1 ead/Ea22-like family protein [Enterobacter hormaechei]ELC6302972.1 ead/Ea22-like family protein [Enterobacter hormaechei]EMF0897346.1 ead/Ea22-like family protein [Enterobacter hormaechei]